MHLIHIEDLGTDDLHGILANASRMEMRNIRGTCRDATFLCYFSQPSTRTRVSTQAAMIRLGGRIVSVDEMSQLRREPIADSFRCISSLFDLIAIRYPHHDAVEDLSRIIKTPILNCGTGSSSHPTQTLADLYFIQRTFGRLDGVRVLILGDLTLRASRSLINVRKSAGLRVDVCNPKMDVRKWESSSIDDYADIGVVEWIHLDNALSSYDVVYVKPLTSVDYTSSELEHRSTAIASAPLLSAAQVRNFMRPSAILLHSLPRFGELDPAIDELIQAQYFKLAELAIYPRMAVISYLLGVADGG